MSRQRPGGKRPNNLRTFSRKSGTWLKRLSGARICAKPSSRVSRVFVLNLLPFPGSHFHISLYRNLMKLAAVLHPAACLGHLVTSAPSEGPQLQTTRTDIKQILQVNEFRIILQVYGNTDYKCIECFDREQQRLKQPNPPTPMLFYIL